MALTGTALELDAKFEVVKKLKLVGYPDKIFKKTAFIKGMFNSDLEVCTILVLSLFLFCFLFLFLFLFFLRTILAGQRLVEGAVGVVADRLLLCVHLRLLCSLQRLLVAGS